MTTTPRKPGHRRERSDLARSRRLQAALAAGAAATLLLSCFLLVVTLPAGARLSAVMAGELTAAADLQADTNQQAADDRAYASSGDPAWLWDYNHVALDARADEARIRAAGPGQRAALAPLVHSQAALDAAHGDLVGRLAAGDRPGVEAALDAEEPARRRAGVELGHLLDTTAVDATRALDHNRVRAELATLLLACTGVALAVATFALGRGSRRAEEAEAVDTERRRLREAQRVAQLGIFERDIDTGDSEWSEHMFELLGYEPGGVTPGVEAFLARVHPDDVGDVGAATAVRRPGDRVEAVFRVVRPDGEVRWLSCLGEVLARRHGRPGRTRNLLVGTAVDITARESATAEIRHARDRLLAQEAEMRQRAYHDPLTGLANRALLGEELAAAVSGRRRASVLLLDLDGFKRINDSLGHDVGDALIVTVARRLEAAVRARPGRPDALPGAPGGDLVARLGGDEFGILLSGVGEEGAVAVAGRVVEELGRPFLLGGRSLVVSASVGVVVSGPEPDAASVLRDADVAMYEAKRAGGGRWELFDPPMQQVVAERLNLEAELRSAITAGNLTVLYQPVVQAGTGQIDAVEALLRWRRDDGAMAAPDQFIPLAEETGLIVPLGEWVLRQACADVAGLRERFPGLRLAVNLSARQLNEQALVGVVTSALSSAGIPPGDLTLEVTESLLVDQGAVAGGTLERLRAAGVRLAMDDFGTGYSSLSRLRDLEVDELKIDKSFVDDITVGDGATLVEAIVGIAHSLDRTVVAEGVETPAQLQVLTALGCDRVQGFLLGRPVPPGDLLPPVTTEQVGAG